MNDFSIQIKLLGQLCASVHSVCVCVCVGGGGGGCVLEYFQL